MTAGPKGLENLLRCRFGSGELAKLGVDWRRYCEDACEEHKAAEIVGFRPPARPDPAGVAAEEELLTGSVDLAELRRDGSQSFYALFAPKSARTPLSLLKMPSLAAIWAFMAFTCVAVKHLLLAPETVVMFGLGFLSTMLCSPAFLDIRPSIDKNIINISLVFPTMFLITQNFVRRQKQAKAVHLLRANGIQLVMKILTGSGIKHHNPKRARQIVEVLYQLFEDVGGFLPFDSALSGPRAVQIYKDFAYLQAQPECALLTRFMLCEFEKLRVERDYRAPFGMTYFCFFFGYFSPVFLGPFFARIGCPPGSAADLEATCGIGNSSAFASLAAMVVIVSGLLRIVKDLEDPFDFSGCDDVLVKCRFERNVLLKACDEWETGSEEKQKALEAVLNLEPMKS